MKLGSLFDGSGGFPLAGSLCGIEPVFASEVEPYTIAVTRSRFPNMKHLGSVTDINGGDIEPVDIITHAAINGKPQKEYTKAQMLTWYNKLHTDSSEYKMWGNGISLPTSLYVMQGIAEVLKGGESDA